MPTRDQILAAIQIIAADRSGEPPGAIQFHRKTGFRESDWRGVYWARWSDALKEAGFEPNEWQSKTEEAVLFVKLAEAVSQFERFPTSAEMKLCRKRDKGFPNAKVAERYGGLSGLSQALSTWLTANGQLHIAALIKPPVQKVALRTDSSADGFVYLIGAGNFYKIGRSNELERRVKEIRVALPDTADLVHAIRTDDPAGIEAYWHRRFAERRANGEWFKLDAADVKAFKRRRFQ